MTEQGDIDGWIAEVRDPAENASEGRRTIRCGKGQVEASYEIAPLAGGRWAIKLWCHHQSSELGSMAARGGSSRLARNA